jgi:excisionase family DNA binding protein
MSPPKKRNPAAPDSANGADRNQLATAEIVQHPGVSIKEASWHFSVHRKTIERWIKSGKLKVERLPSGRARIILEAVK